MLLSSLSASHFILLLGGFAIFGDACLQTAKVNECGCFDYSLMSRAKLAAIDPDIWQTLSNGSFSAPEYTYQDCTYIHISCPGNSSLINSKLVRTNWPDRDLILINNIGYTGTTATLFFDVACDPTTHEWKYTPVDDKRELLTEPIICHHDRS